MLKPLLKHQREPKIRYLKTDKGVEVRKMTSWHLFSHCQELSPGHLPLILSKEIKKYIYKHALFNCCLFIVILEMESGTSLM